MIKRIESYIAPWALPNEEVPVTLTFLKDIQFDVIEVEISNNIDLIEFFNVNDYEMKDSKFIITSLKDFSENKNYFGFIIKNNSIPEKLSSKYPLSIIFKRENKTIEKIDLFLKIFRPQISPGKFENKIIIPKDIKKRILINLDLIYEGFGDIKISLIAKIGGEVVSQEDELGLEVIERLKDLQKIKDELELKKKLEISPQLVDQATSEIINIVNISKKNENFSEAVLNLFNNVPNILESLKDKSNPIRAQIELALLSLFDDLLKSNLTDRITLRDSSTYVHTKIEIPITKINIELNYNDLVGNIYTPLEIVLDVEDNRDFRRGRMELEIPVKISKIVDKGFYNVGEMKIDR